MTNTLLSSYFPGGSSGGTNTVVTTGTGVFVPSVNNALCRVRIQGAGGGGGAVYIGPYNGIACGGGGGAYLEVWIRVPSSGYPYAVGVGGTGAVAGGGTAATSGSASSFAWFLAPGGGGGSFNIGGQGGMGGYAGSFNNGAPAYTTVFGGSSYGIAGGSGGNYATGNPNGFAAGCPFQAEYDNGSGLVKYPIFASYSAIAIGSATYGGGGDSYLGAGGPANASPSMGYGGGGGAGTGGNGFSGANGYIEITDFGPI